MKDFRRSHPPKQMPEEIDREFTIGKVLGTGAYGKVRLAFQKNSCRRVAVKIIEKEKLGGDSSSASQEVVASSQRKGLTPTLQTKVRPSIRKPLEYWIEPYCTEHALHFWSSARDRDPSRYQSSVRGRR